MHNFWVFQLNSLSTWTPTHLKFNIVTVCGHRTVVSLHLYSFVSVTCSKKMKKCEALSQRDIEYLLIIHNAWSDLGGLITGSALNSEGPLVKGLPRDAIVWQLDVHRLLHLPEGTWLVIIWVKGLSCLYELWPTTSRDHTRMLSDFRSQNMMLFRWRYASPAAIW